MARRTTKSSGSTRKSGARAQDATDAEIVSETPPAQPDPEATAAPPSGDTHATPDPGAPHDAPGEMPPPESDDPGATAPDTVTAEAPMGEEMSVRADGVEAEDATATTEAEPKDDTAPPPEAAPETEAAASVEAMPESDPEPEVPSEPVDGTSQVEATPDAAGDAPSDTADTPEEPPKADAAPRPAPAPAPARSGPSVLVLLLGGVIAVGLGYGATLMGWLPAPGGAAPGGAAPEEDAALETFREEQSQAMAALRDQIAALAEAQGTPAPAPEIDLSPITDQIADVGARIDATASAIDSLAGRVSVLEDRPVFTGDVGTDAAEAAAALAAMEEQLRAQEEEAARIAAEAEDRAAAAAEEAAAAEAAAAEAVAAAEAEAQAAMAEAEAEAALAELRAAIVSGAPYADTLPRIAAVTDVPEALAAHAEDGAPTIPELQAGFPAAARAALPVALRETAGDAPLDRTLAFLQGQIGGRAVTPREGDDPNAVLSRAQAAVSDGDMGAALAEIAALPEGAQAEMAAWAAEAQTRVAVEEALETVGQALSGAN